MADQSNADSRHHLTIAHPEQITKDMQGPDNPIPLSPQWLLPKPQENKLGIGTGEAHFRPHANRSDGVKASGNGDDFLDTERKKDVFRPSFMDTETGRRDRWRDEEREINSAIRKDRWREGEKEPGDSRRTERRMDNSSKHSAEARWVSSERWNESGNRDREGSYDQRRDSKWNTRWGPDDREPEGRREKWSDSGRDGDGSRDKGILHSAAHGKNMDREGDHNSRTWRSNSQNRGRGESPYHQNLTPNKQGPMFGHGRGRGENSTTVFSMGRGKATHSGNSANNSSYSLGPPLDKSDGAHGDSRLRYSRMKLLDIYRLTDVSNFRKPLEGFVQVSSLTQEEPLEPLALSAPTSDESVILKGIDKGDVVNSGAPQISKDGSVGRNSNDVVHLRQTKLGSRDDLWSAADDNKEESTANLKEGSVHYKVDEMVPKEASMWRSQSVDEQRSLHDWKDLPPEVRSRSSVIGWSHSQKDQEIDKKTESVFPSSYYNDEVNLQNEGSLRSDRRIDSDITRRSSEILDQEREALSNFQPQSSPEDLSYYYKDPQGKVQGPFSGSDLIGWFEAGYFGIDLQVRVASAPPDRPFSQLGDAMPHLRMKARPPPGFNNPKQNEALEVTSRAQIGDVGTICAGLGEVDLMKNDQRSRHLNATETENRFLESLMSGQISSPPLEKLYMSEGLQGYSGIGGGGLPSMGAESGNDLNYLLAQKMSLERQRSLSNALQYWPGNDAASMQHVDLLSILQAAMDKPPASVVNNGATGWSNIPDVRSNNTVHGSVDILQDKADIHQNSHFASQAGFGIQHQTMQMQNPTPSHIITQTADHPSNMAPSEKFLSGIPQDIFENASQPKNWGATPLQQVESIQSTESLSIPASEVTEKPLQEVPFDLKKHTLDSESAAAVVQEGLSLDKKADVLVVPTPLESFTSPKQDTVVSSDRSGKIDSTISGQGEMDGSLGSILEESQMQRGEINVDSPAVKEVKNVEGREAKKASEKKSRKQKNSKAQSVIDGAKGISNAGKQDIEIEGRDTGGLKFETPVKTYETPHGTSHLGTGVSHSSAPAQVSHQVQPHLSRSTSPSKVETGADKAEVREIESASLLNAQTPSGHRAWKPAPGLKPKSLLEIQQEEQQRAQTVMVVPEVVTPNVSRSSGTTTPWVGVVANSELKSNKDVHQEASGLHLVSSNSESITTSKSKKSQLHDLLAEEVLSKSNESILDVPSVSDKGGLLSSQPPAVTQVDPVSVGEDDFVEAKDTKKNRKKAAKAKAAAGKTAAPVASTEISSSPVLIERGKSSRQMQQENDNLPAAPSGPSLADFVFWKGEQPSSVPAPAWSTDSAKLNKQTSLRDILKEQEKRAPSAPLQVSIPTSTKPQATRITRTSSSSWQLHGSSPSKVASPVQISSAASTQSKNKTEDDLFWGPLDQSKQDTKQSEYPSLSNHSSRGTKAPTVKGSPGATTIRQKPSGSKPIDYSFSSSPSASLSSSKGKRDATTKYAEAMDFREWCESESIRLTGASDMSFLEFCSKQSTSEAEMLLKENLGPLDPDHKFIDKFLNYKELLSADVIEIAFQARGERRATGDVVGRPNTDYAVTARESQADAGLEASAKGGGKKKGKKAKKVPASVLGFNVVSNRIMMGEIQTIED
ncbi:Zinc finger CCCH domain-containing protein 19 [Acorus gramineus]|uniref:Zinc finger CCCH domain-containing protein 19 n=1 Tax=Acorus gramineus TaxID=55184 RepID=A0AAV9BJN0_ACOGR|nr:Zinc finger CCCH domain-containing protein 19 [Acorus gramineus]